MSMIQLQNESPDKILFCAAVSKKWTKEDMIDMFIKSVKEAGESIYLSEVSSC